MRFGLLPSRVSCVLTGGADQWVLKRRDRSGFARVNKVLGYLLSVFNKNSSLKLENDLETNNKQTNVIDLTMRTLMMHTHTHTHTQTHTHVVRVCVSVCEYVRVCAWAGVRGQVCLCVCGWVYVV